MSDQHTPAPVDRMLDLLAEQAGGGLSDAQQAELDALLRESLDHGTGEFDEAAAALAESFAAEVEFESMPSHVRERCIGSARAVMSEAPIESKSSAPVPLRFTPLREPSRSGFSIGWLAAAACLALAVFGWLPRPSTTTRRPVTSGRPGCTSPATTSTAWSGRWRGDPVGWGCSGAWFGTR